MMTKENNDTDEYFQNILQENGLPPETTKGQYMWWALKRATKRAGWVALIFTGFSAVVLWHFAPDMLLQIVGVLFVALGIAWPFLVIIGGVYIGLLIVKALRKAARD